MFIDRSYKKYIPQCQGLNLPSDAISSSCKEFIARNPKAKLQLELELRFIEFEAD